MKFTIPIRIKSRYGTFQSATWTRKRRKAPRSPGKRSPVQSSVPPSIPAGSVPIPLTVDPASVPLPVPSIAEDRERVKERLASHVKGKLKPVSEILPKKTCKQCGEKLNPSDESGFCSQVCHFKYDKKDSMESVHKVKEPTLRERKRIKRQNVKLARETVREAKQSTPSGKPKAWTCVTMNCMNYGKRIETISNWNCPKCFNKFQPLKD